MGRPSPGERPLLARPTRREVAPPLAPLDRLPLAGRSAQQVERRDPLHEFVNVRPPPEADRILRARRGDVGPVVRRAAYVVFAFVILQVIIAAAMVLLHLPPVLRSLHEAAGVGVWLSAYTLAYLARIAARPRPVAGAGS